MMITGELKRWYYNEHTNVYFGLVYNDVKGRFPDGSRIYTSEVVREDKSNPEVILVHTKYSLYLLRLENRLEDGDGNPWERLRPKRV